MKGKQKLGKKGFHGKDICYSTYYMHYALLTILGGQWVRGEGRRVEKRAGNHPPPEEIPGILIRGEGGSCRLLSVESRGVGVGGRIHCLFVFESLALAPSIPLRLSFFRRRMRESETEGELNSASLKTPSPSQHTCYSSFCSPDG